MIVTPTLHFYGQCEEAIGLYQKAFDLRTSYILYYSGADPSDWNVTLTEEQQAYVYHSEAYIGGQRFMLADEIGQEASTNTSLFLTITFETADQVKQAYEVLTDGGSIIHPLRSTTYSSCMASVVDKFGFRWGLMTEQTER
jgi:PhnB protein